MRNRISRENGIALQQPIRSEQLARNLYSSHGAKTPGQDGFGAKFSKHSWKIIGEAFTQTVLHIFSVVSCE